MERRERRAGVARGIGVAVLAGFVLLAADRPTEAAPALAPLDHVMCYAVGATPFAPKSLLLRDQFGSTQTKVKGMTRLCNPAKVGAVGVAYPAAHLACHTIEAIKAKTFEPRKVVVKNRFGTFGWVLIKPVALCVASSKSVAPAAGAAAKPPPPIPTTLDHFRCYAANGNLAKKTLPVTDQFQNVQRTVTKAAWLCAPARLNGSATKHPAAHLSCYTVGQQPFAPRGVAVRSRFGVSSHVANGPAVLCVPAKKTAFPVLDVKLAGDGAGQVISLPAGINCFQKIPSASAPDCGQQYPPGATVTLKAGLGPKPELTGFVGWSGVCSGTGDCVVTMDASKKVTATFAGKFPTLKVTKVGPGNGIVASNPPGIFCGQVCGAPFPAGTLVTLKADPNQGSEFIGWGGPCSGTGDCVVTIAGPTEVTAFFDANYFTLSVTKTGSGSGTVTSEPPGINCGQDCVKAIGKGFTLTLKATPDPGSSFVGWSGACSGTGQCTLVMDADKSVTATFARLSGPPPGFQLSVSTEGPGSGTVTSTPGGIDCGSDCTETYPAGTEVTLNAVAERGSDFGGWRGACSGTGACRVTMDAAKSVTAIFTFARGRY